MLILDPIVLLFRTDDSGPQQLSRLLGYLRGLQRHFLLAIAVVHHSSVALSSSEFDPQPHIPDALSAWADSMLLIKNHDGQLRLHINHRFAAAPDPVSIELVPHRNGLGPLLKVASSPAEQSQLTLPLSVVAL